MLCRLMFKRTANSIKADIFLIDCVPTLISPVPQHYTIQVYLHTCVFVRGCLTPTMRACVCACMILTGDENNICVSGRERERKAKYPGVCSHGYYHDVGGAGLLSPSCASLSHSLKVALADESLHSMPLAQTHQPTQPASQPVSQTRTEMRPTV